MSRGAGVFGQGRNNVALSLLEAAGEAGPTDIQGSVIRGRDGGIELDVVSVFIVEIIEGVQVVHGERMLASRIRILG